MDGGMQTDNFEQLKRDFQTLGKKLKDCTDKAERKRLLAKMKATIDKLDRINAERKTK